MKKMGNKCSICSDFKDKEYGFHKFGSEINTINLPENAKKLIIIKDIKTGSDRLKQLKQCPECKTYYFYNTDYEYYAFGSEDEEFLIRLTLKKALEILNSNNT